MFDKVQMAVPRTLKLEKVDDEDLEKETMLIMLRMPMIKEKIPTKRKPEKYNMVPHGIRCDGACSEPCVSRAKRLANETLQI